MILLNNRSSSSAESLNWACSDTVYALNMTGTTGSIATLGSVTGGSLYTNGTYTNVPLTGGTGAVALATVVVSGNAVTTVTITSAGLGYTAADSLSATAANIGGTGSGFSVPVSTITAYTAVVQVPIVPPSASIAAPYSLLVNFSGSVNYYVNFNGTLASAPAANNITGTAPELNPTIRNIGSLKSFSVATTIAGVIIMSWFVAQ